MPSYLPTNICALPGGEVYAFVRGSGMYRTLDSGRTWSPLASGLPPGKLIHCMARSGAGDVFAAFDDSGLYRINGGSVGWTRVTPPFDSIGKLSVACLPSGAVLCASSKDSLYRSTNEGQSWTAVSNAGAAYGIDFIAASANGTLAASAGTKALLSSDEGRTWQSLPDPQFDSNEWLGVLAVDSKNDVFWNTYDLGAYPPSGSVYRWKGGDSSWTLTYTRGFGIDPSAGISMELDAQDRLFIGGAPGVLYSLDAGNSWQTSAGAPEYVRSLAMSPNGTLYAGCSDGVDRNASPIPRGRLSCSTVTDPADVLHFNSVTRDYEGIPSSKGPYTVFPLDVIVRNTGADVSGFNEVITAPTWIKVDSVIGTLPDVLASNASTSVRLILRAIPDSTARTAIFLCTAWGINADSTVCTSQLIAEKALVTGVSASAVSEGISLARNFPNPFSTVTTIAYTLPAEMNATLVVYDALGCPVCVLIDGRQAAGRHEAEFDVGGLAPGLYVYRLVTPHATLHGTMVVTR